MNAIETDGMAQTMNEIDPCDWDDINVKDDGDNMD